MPAGITYANFSLALALLASCSPSSERDAQRALARPERAAWPREHEHLAPRLAWPDGWMVVSENEWVPAANTVGRELCAARKYLFGADRGAARNHLLAAASAARALAQESAAAEDVSTSQLRQSATQLDELATELSQGRDHDQAFDDALIAAHRASLRWEWAHRDTEQLLPWLEEPRLKFQRARNMLRAHAGAAAAVRLRQGTGYLYLLATGTRTSERAPLQAALGKLGELAHEADVGELAPDVLRAELARIEGVFAASQLHEAGAHYREHERRHAGRALRSAAVRMRARADSLGHGDGELAQEVEQAGMSLERGARPSERRIADLVTRAELSLGVPPGNG